MGKERYRNNLQKSEKIRKKSHRNRTKKGGTDTIYILVLDKKGPVTKIDMDHYKNEHKQKLASVHSELKSLFEKSRQEFVSVEAEAKINSVLVLGLQALVLMIYKVKSMHLLFSPRISIRQVEDLAQKHLKIALVHHSLL